MYANTLKNKEHLEEMPEEFKNKFVTGERKTDILENLDGLKPQ
jgi:UDP-N-acetylglucosamine 2-epimerase